MVDKGMQMKKQLSILFLLLVLVFVSFSSSTESFAIENDTSNKDGQVLSESDSLEKAYFTYPAEDRASLEIKDDNSIDPLAEQLVRTKTITKSYTSFSNVPETYYYPEYYQGNWYRGTLLLTQVVKTSTGWSATFSGKIYAYVE